MSVFRIGNRIIGEGYPAYIIAEMSGNHAGSIERAKEIIREAKRCGADCIKIQTYTPDTITMDCDNEYFQIEQGTWNGENLYQLYGKAYTPWEWQKELKEEADRIGIDFFSTPFDKTSVDFLESIGMEFYKIASFELVDLPLIRYVAEKGKPIILSTGMSELAEIQEAADTIRATGNHQFAFLRCASAYPAISDEMNLATMVDMSERFNVPVGLSDHSMGGLAAVTAVAMGASIIEKHFCLSRDIENPDSSFSMEPEEFEKMVNEIRQAEKAMGRVSYGVTKQEKSNHIFRKSIFVTKDVKEGETFTEENVRVIRPGYGLHPREFENVLGKEALCDVGRGMPLKASYVKDYLELKPADMQHCELVFGWSNDSETRKWSFSTESIPWETHEKWYKESLERKDRELLICYRMGIPVGQLRLDVSGENAVLSYSIAKAYRNRGYGAELLRAGERWVRFNMPRIKYLIADTKKENMASGNILIANGYVRREEEGFTRYTKQIK